MILDRAESTIFQLAEDRVRVGLIGVKDLVNENFERLEKIFSEGRRITGLATGYSGLDNETAGLQPSELIILAARPSMGKTALALNIAENVVCASASPSPFSAWKCRRSRCCSACLLPKLAWTRTNSAPAT